MKKYKKKKNHLNLLKKNRLFLFFIMVASLLLGIGYAQISPEELDVEGIATVDVAHDILITKVEYVSNTNADPSQSIINDTYLTNMNSKIVLGNDLTSSITYKITIKNNSDVPQTYDDAIYSTTLGYDNTDIEFELNGITNGNQLEPGDEIEFTITFKYNASLATVPDNKELNSLINFKFDNANYVAKVGNNYFTTLQAAIDATPTDGTATTVEVLKDWSENVQIPSTRNVILDLKNHTLSNDGNFNVIKNYGRLSISNGTITSDAATNGTVNNENTGTISISGGTLRNTGGRQAFYNDRGTATISGTAHIEATTNQRYAAENKGGNLTITGGTIISTGNGALTNNATMVIGEEGGGMSTTSPVFQGITYGINSSTNYSFYDGIAKGKTRGVNNDAKAANKETGYSIVQGEETIEGALYKTSYLAVPRTVRFDPRSGTASETTRIVADGSKLGTLPTAERSGYFFAGWWTAATGGTEITSDTIITANITYYAHWESRISAEMDGVQYNTVQEAINNVPTDETEKTIIVLRDVIENITIPAGKNVEFDLDGYTFRNAGTAAVMENNGIVHITNGNFTTNGKASLINNNAGGKVYITGGSLIATGERQIIYNLAGGEVEISGDAFLSSTATGAANQSNLTRSTVQNLTGGTINIKGGTIINSVGQAVANEGIMNIGIEYGSIDSTSPFIRGETNGIKNAGTLNYFDGTAKGITDAISGTITTTESGSTPVTGTEVIDGKTYKTYKLS